MTSWKKISGALALTRSAQPFRSARLFRIGAFRDAGNSARNAFNGSAAWAQAANV
jgi:hypothetical protein